MYCGLRQNSREGNSREEWMGEVSAWVRGWVGIVEETGREFFEARRT